MRAVVPQLTFASFSWAIEPPKNSWDSPITARLMLACKLKLQNRYSSNDQSVETDNATTNGEALRVNQCG